MRKSSKKGRWFAARQGYHDRVPGCAWLAPHPESFDLFLDYGAGFSRPLRSRAVKVNLVSRAVSNATLPDWPLSFDQQQAARKPRMIATLHGDSNLYPFPIRPALKSGSNSSLPGRSCIVFCTLHSFRMRQGIAGIEWCILFLPDRQRPQHSQASRGKFQRSGY
jgi:hypothetical protein